MRIYLIYRIPAADMEGRATMEDTKLPFCASDAHLKQIAAALNKLPLHSRSSPFLKYC